MPFWNHVDELRIRLIKSIISVILFTLVAYYFSGLALYFLIDNNYTTENQETLLLTDEMDNVGGLDIKVIQGKTNPEFKKFMGIMSNPIFDDHIVNLGNVTEYRARAHEQKK